MTRIAWNKGTKLDEAGRKKLSVAHIGISQNAGERNHFWKGEKAGYMALHDWIRSKYGTPLKCSKCGKEGGSTKGYHWANKYHKYSRSIEDYMRLCASCHIQYDYDMGFRKKKHKLH
jgi:hypothetical protein